jgi:hypothetical protein
MLVVGVAQMWWAGVVSGSDLAGWVGNNVF